MKRLFTTFTAIVALLVGVAAHGQVSGQVSGQAPEPDVLKPEQAFQYTVSAVADALVVRWNIRPEYYLYKERMSFESRTPGITLGAAQMPAGELHSDEYFGDMHIYRGTAEIRLPLAARDANVNSIALAIKSQGCADIGLCYPPQVWVSNVSLPTTGASGGGAGPATGLAALLNRNTSKPKDEPLPVEEAFRYSINAGPLHAAGQVDDSPWLLPLPSQAGSGDEQLISRAGATITAARRAQSRRGVRQHTRVSRRSHDDHAAHPQRSGASSLPLTIHYQGCKEDSICYPPQTVATSVSLPPAVAGTTAAAATGTETSEQDQLFLLIRDGNLLAVLAIFGGLGLLLSFTPCCLPMYPILSGIIVGQGKADGAPLGTSKAFLLSLAFVIGMALTYTILGAVFAAAGAQVQAVMQQPVVIIGVALLFVALALSMFGLFDLQIPTSWQTKLNSISGQQRSGSLVGAAIMGFISAAVITTCVTPPLVAALAVIAKTGDVTRVRWPCLRWASAWAFRCLRSALQPGD
ncbi:MAG: protein-disulfide reductase DsbD family protein [Gammaproteobacteria bacterium]